MHEHIPRQWSQEGASLSFTAAQAAALCGISVPELLEWTELGYVRSEGQGDRRTYNRESLREIMVLRRSLTETHPANVAPLSPESAAQQRPEEFSVLPTAPDDDQLTIQVELIFGMNQSTESTSEELAARMGVDERQMTRVLSGLVRKGDIIRSSRGNQTFYRPGQVPSGGPGPRERRIRAVRRRRIPS